MKKLALMFFAGSVLMSCVNEEYDLSKIDGTAVFAKDIAMPVGNLQKLSVNQILDMTSETEFISKDADGNLTFVFNGGEPQSESITVPSFTIPFEDEITGNDHLITLYAGALAGQSGPAINQQVHLTNQRVEKVIKIEEDHKLPYQVLDAEYVELDMLIDYTFRVSSGAGHIAEGFQMDFPDWITLVKFDESSDYIVENQEDNKNVVRFLRDVKIYAGTPYIVDLKVTRVDFPEGSIVNAGNDAQGNPCKKVWVDEDKHENKIIATGDIYMDTNDFPTIPEQLDVIMHLEFRDFDVKAAKVSLDMEFDLPDMTVADIDYPDFFKTEGLVMDLYDVFLRFNIANPLPLQMELNADFAAYKNSEVTDNVHLGAGATNGTAPLSVPAESNDAVLLFSRRGGEGIISLPQLGSLMTSLPDKVEVTNISAACSHDYVTVVPGTKYTCYLGYELYAPLAFGKDFRFAYDLDIENIGLDLGEYGIRSASIVFNAANSLPLNFDISALALDAEGQPSDVSLEVVGKVASGTQDSPVVSPIEIRLKSDGKAITLNTLKLKLTASGPSDAHLGTPLNEAQGLKINDLALRLPDGITVDMAAIFKMDPAPEDESEEM